MYGVHFCIEFGASRDGLYDFLGCWEGMYGSFYIFVELCEIGDHSDLVAVLLPTKNAGLHQSEGVDTGVMIFFSSRSCTAALAGTSIRLGITLAVVTLSGTITPSFR